MFARSYRALLKAARLPSSPPDRRLPSCRRPVMTGEPLKGVPSDSHGNTATITQDPPQALPELCAQVHARVAAFLRTEPGTERLRNVQQQSRLSLRILEEALDRYRYAFPFTGQEMLHLD